MLSTLFRDSSVFAAELVHYTMNYIAVNEGWIGAALTADDLEVLNIIRPLNMLTMLELDALAFMASDWDIPVVIVDLPPLPNDLIVKPVSLTFLNYTQAILVVAPIASKMKPQQMLKQVKAVKSKLKRLEPYKWFCDNIKVVSQ